MTKCLMNSLLERASPVKNRAAQTNENVVIIVVDGCE